MFYILWYFLTLAFLQTILPSGSLYFDLQWQINFKGCNLTHIKNNYLFENSWRLSPKVKTNFFNYQTKFANIRLIGPIKLLKLHFSTFFNFSGKLSLISMKECWNQINTTVMIPLHVIRFHLLHIHFKIWNLNFHHVCQACKKYYS